MKNFEMLQKVCIDEVLGAGIEPGNIVSWVINRRAKTRWGMCTKNPDGTCIIQIAARLIEDERISEQACKETMIHEILHTCKGCKGHTGLWLIYANIMNKKYGYNIKRTTSGEEKGVENYTASKILFRMRELWTDYKKKKTVRIHEVLPELYVRDMREKAGIS